MTGDWLLDIMIACVGLGGLSLLVLRTPLYEPVMAALGALFGMLPQRRDSYDYVEQAEIKPVPAVVLADTDAVPPKIRTSTEPARALTKDDIITAVATLWPEKSANEIAAFFGGARADTLKAVKVGRVEQPAPPASPAGVNPISGRHTSAQFDDLPALALPTATRRQRVDEETGALLYE